MTRNFIALSALVSFFAVSSAAHADRATDFNTLTSSSRTSSYSTTTTTRDSVELKPIGVVETDENGYIGLKPIGWIQTDSDGEVSLKPIGGESVALQAFEWSVDPEDAFLGTTLAVDFASLKPIGIIEDNGTDIVGLKPIGLVSDGVSLKPIGLDSASVDSISLKPIGWEASSDLVGLKPIGSVSLDDDGYVDVRDAGNVQVSSSLSILIQSRTR